MHSWSNRYGKLLYGPVIYWYIVCIGEITDWCRCICSTYRGSDFVWQCSWWTFSIRYESITFSISELWLDCTKCGLCNADLCTCTCYLQCIQGICFKKIGGLRALTDVPIIALTATAPQVTREMIYSSLGLTEPAVILHTLDRQTCIFHLQKQRP